MGQIIDPTETTIELQLLRSPEGRVFYEMSLRSKAKPRCISKREIAHDAKKIELQMAAAAGALAEHQNEVYKDWHDPERVAHTGIKAYKRLQQKIHDEGIEI